MVSELTPVQLEQREQWWVQIHVDSRKHFKFDPFSYQSDLYRPANRNRLLVWYRYCQQHRSSSALRLAGVPSSVREQSI